MHLLKVKFHGLHGLDDVDHEVHAIIIEGLGGTCIKSLCRILGILIFGRERMQCKSQFNLSNALRFPCEDFHVRCAVAYLSRYRRPVSSLD